MARNANTTSHDSPSDTSKAVLHLVGVAKDHENPDHRIDALEMLLHLMPAPAMVQLLINQLRRDVDMSILWLCLGWLLQRYGEDKDAAKAILGRLENEPDPTLRRDILRLVSLRLGSSDLVRRTVARMTVGDPDHDVRADAAETLAELEQLRYGPPATPAGRSA